MEEGIIYRVVGLIDEPVVVLEPFHCEDGDEREHHVISSPAFAARFTKLVPTTSEERDGSRH